MQLIFSITYCWLESYSDFFVHILIPSSDIEGISLPPVFNSNFFEFNIASLLFGLKPVGILNSSCDSDKFYACYKKNCLTLFYLIESIFYQLETITKQFIQSISMLLYFSKNFHLRVKGFSPLQKNAEVSLAELNMHGM